MAQDSGQTSCRVRRPGEDQSLRTLSNIAMQTDIRRYGARPVEHQVVTVPDPQPQRGPPVATGKANQEEKRRQQHANAILPHLRWLETPDMAQSGGGPQEALGTDWDTAADCGLRLTHRTENLAWPGTQKKKKETEASPADRYLLPEHRALWSESPSQEAWHFTSHPVWVQTIWPNPRPRPSVLPKICWEMSANMAAGCWSGDQAVGLSRKPLPDGWFCGISRTEDLTCMAVDHWRRTRMKFAGYMILPFSLPLSSLSHTHPLSST